MSSIILKSNATFQLGHDQKSYSMYINTTSICINNKDEVVAKCEIKDGASEFLYTTHVVNDLFYFVLQKTCDRGNHYLYGFDPEKRDVQYLLKGLNDVHFVKNRIVDTGGCDLDYPLYLTQRTAVIKILELNGLQKPSLIRQEIRQDASGGWMASVNEDTEMVRIWDQGTQDYEFPIFEEK